MVPGRGKLTNTPPMWPIYFYFITGSRFLGKYFQFAYNFAVVLGLGSYSGQRSKPFATHIYGDYHSKNLGKLGITKHQHPVVPTIHF